MRGPPSLTLNGPQSTPWQQMRWTVVQRKRGLAPEHDSRPCSSSAPRGPQSTLWRRVRWTMVQRERVRGYCSHLLLGMAPNPRPGVQQARPNSSPSEFRSCCALCVSIVRPAPARNRLGRLVCPRHHIVDAAAALRLGAHEPQSLYGGLEGHPPRAEHRLDAAKSVVVEVGPGPAIPWGSRSRSTWM